MPVDDNFGFYAIVTEPVRGYDYLTRLLVERGVVFVQLRMKDRPDAEVLSVARLMRRITEGTATRFIVNDNPRVAREVAADGVHVGQNDMPIEQVREIVGPGAIIGLSTHTVAQTAEACAKNPGYIGVGPVFATPTKKIPDPVIGIDGMKKMLARATVPAVAIGGIDLENLSAVLAAGARNFCMVRQINKLYDPEKALDRMALIVADAARSASR